MMHFVTKAMPIDSIDSKCHVKKLKSSSVIYQISDIGTDDQISEVGIQSIIYQTRYFALNILRDNYAIHFLSGTQVKTKM